MTAYPETHPASTPGGGDPVVLLHGGNVANWMWEPQVEALRDRLVITPHLPGFGARVAEDWPGADAAADDIVERVTGLGVTGRFHLVGLSLGAVVALRAAARHPDRVASAFVTGAPLEPVGGALRAMSGLQLALWDARWFWRAQAVAFRLPEDAREEYVEHGMSVRKETGRRMRDDVYAGGVPAELADYPRPLLLVAGEKEPAALRRSLRAARAVVPHAELRLAPGMHHIWSIEDVDLFNATMREWLDGRIEPRLLPVADA